jgi:hypothetical protein
MEKKQNKKKQKQKKTSYRQVRTKVIQKKNHRKQASNRTYPRLKTKRENEGANGLAVF